MIARLRELVRRRPELIALAGFLLVACVVLIVAKLGSEIGEGEIPTFDATLVRAARGAVDGNSTLRSIMLDLTAIGDTTTLIVLTALIVGFFALGRDWATASYLAVATGVGALATTVLKLTFQRARPDIVAHLVPTSTAIFPSGHAMNSGRPAYWVDPRYRDPMPDLERRVDPATRVREHTHRFWRAASPEGSDPLACFR